VGLRRDLGLVFAALVFGDGFCTALEWGCKVWIANVELKKTVDRVEYENWFETMLRQGVISFLFNAVLEQAVPTWKLVRIWITRDMGRDNFFYCSVSQTILFGLSLNKFGRCSNRYVVACEPLWGRHVRNGGKLA
jgi:hypothetical protein